MTDPGWAARREPHTGIWITPIDGWGFLETIDGELADPFEVVIDDAAVDIGNGILGWRGHVITRGHKYFGMPFTMQPRRTEWTKVVVINVKNGAFGGMADSDGLDCDWK